MSRTQRILVFCLLFFLLFLFVTLLGHQSSSRIKLQAYRSSLLSQGEKLTYSALTASRPTNLSDSSIVFSNAAVRLRAGQFNVAWLSMRTYVGPGQARALCLRERGDTAASTKAPTWDDLEAEIAKLQTPLADIREAMKDPQPDWNMGTNILSGVPNFIAIRSAAQWLAEAALCDLHNGRLEEGLKNIEALIGVARMNRDEYTLVAQMIRIAVAGLGLATTWEALQVPGWTGSQLARLQSAWQQVDLAESLEKGMLGERAMGEEFWRELRQTNGPQTTSTLLARSFIKTNGFEVFVSEHVLFPVYKITSIDDDELFYLKTMQESLAALRSLRAGGTWSKSNKDLDKTFLVINRVTHSADRFRYFFSSLAIPNFIKALETGARTETERQLAITALALKRYQLDHGAFPSTLAQLTNTYLLSEPRDLMSGNPLRYRLEANGQPVLYSVGLDGVDNGGDASSPQGSRYGLWEGRDAVWPSLAR